MVDLFLKAKHWHLFILTFLLPMVFYIGLMGLILTNFMSSQTPDPTIIFNSYKYFIYIIVFVWVVNFAWFWSVAVGLDKKIPVTYRLKLSRFKMAFFISVLILFLFAYVIGNFFHNAGFGLNRTVGFGWGYNPAIPSILVTFVLVTGLCILYIYYIVAKTIKTAELQRKIGIGDCILELFLIYFFPIGVWFLQPKINKMHADNSDSDNRIDVL